MRPVLILSCLLVSTPAAVAGHPDGGGSMQKAGATGKGDPSSMSFTPERMQRVKVLTDRIDAQIRAAFEGEEPLRDAMTKEMKAIAGQKDRASRSRLILDFQGKYRKDYLRILAKAKVDLGQHAKALSGIVTGLNFTVIDGTHIVGREIALPPPPPAPPPPSQPSPAPSKPSPAPARDPLQEVGRHSPGISAFGPLRDEERTCDGRNAAAGRVMVSESSYAGLQILCRSAASRSTVLDTYVAGENGRDSTMATWANITISASGWAEAVGVAGSSNAGMMAELYVAPGEGYVTNGQQRAIYTSVFAPLFWAAEDVRPDVSFGITLDRYGLPLNLTNGEIHYTIRTVADTSGLGSGAAGAKILVSDYSYERRWPD